MSSNSQNQSERENRIKRKIEKKIVRQILRGWGKENKFANIYVCSLNIRVKH